MKKLSGLFLFFVCLLFISQPPLNSEEGLHSVWAIKDCRVVSISGPVLEKGTIIIRDGLIQAVGEDVQIPVDAEIFDGSNLTAYPGMIDALGQYLLKFPEEKYDPGKFMSGEFTEKDRGITPELCAFDHINLTRATLDKNHSFGITTVHLLPQRGVFTGQGSVFSLSSSNESQALLLKDGFLGIGYSPSSFMVYPNSLMGAVALIKQELSDAVYYDMKQQRWEKEKSGIPRPVYNKKYEILSDYATGKKPVIFYCRNQHDIKRALFIASEFRLKYLICDLNNEAFRVIPELKDARAKVICTLNFKPPVTSLYANRSREEKEWAEKELYVKNAVKLAEAGIPFAFSSLETDDPKSFMEGIQKVIANGLPQEKALEALTINAASFLGLDKAIGSIEKGKIANLVLVEGDILAEKPQVKCVFADGKKYQIKEKKVVEGEKPTVNITGNWEIDIEGAGFKFTIAFTQEEGALSGVMTTPFGAFDFTGGSVTGNQIYFETLLSVGGQDMDLYFTAEVEGDTMRGTVIVGTEDSAEFTGKRIP